MSIEISKAFEKVSEGAKKVLSGSIQANLILTIIFGASMSNMWQLLNILQIITMLPILNIRFSSAFLMITDLFNTLAKF
jgi:hypothetical protein